MPPSLVRAIRLGRLFGSGSGYSLSSRVLGSIVPSLLVPKRQKYGRPVGARVIPYGRAPGVVILTSSLFPLAMLSRPTWLLCCSVNQMFPCLSNTWVWGSFASGLGIG